MEDADSPEEMSRCLQPKPHIFHLLEATPAQAHAQAQTRGTARLGKLTVPDRQSIDTPSYTAVTSRGSIPHVTPDNLRKHIHTTCAYFALEDFVEKKNPPILDFSQTTPPPPPPSSPPRLHTFNALPSTHTSILAARRCLPVTPPLGNTNAALSIYTSTGFCRYPLTDFSRAIRSLRPDILVSPADLLHTSPTPAVKKLVRMVQKTESWLAQLLKDRRQGPEPQPALFASILPVTHTLQTEYLSYLCQDDVVCHLSGLAIYNLDILPHLQSSSSYAALQHLPKLSLVIPSSPHDVLKQVAAGIDVCTVPFVNSVSDAGVALDFTFPSAAAEKTGHPLPLGHNMWSSENQTSLQPLSEDCQCYTCTNHHRAYLHHLLQAKEMLGWNLLQIHNHQVVGQFFADIRSQLAMQRQQQQGADVEEDAATSAEAKGENDHTHGQLLFETACRAFASVYEDKFPEGTGERPRARGYHFKSEVGQEKMNKAAWKNLDDAGVGGTAAMGEEGTA